MADEPKTDTPPAEGAPPADAASAAPQNMLKVLGYYTEPAAQEEVPDPDAGDKKADTPPAEDGKADTPPEEKKGDEVTPPPPPENRARKVTAKPNEAETPLSREDITEAMKAALKPAEAKKEEPLSKYGELLLPEKRALELAQFASKAMPDKYKDMEQREVAWISKNREFIQEKIDADGEFSPDTDQYRELVRKHKPVYQAGDREELFLQRAKAAAKEEARTEFQSQLAERDRRLNEMEARPIIQRVLATIEDDILSVLDKPIAELFKADPKKAMETHGIEAPLTMAIITDTQHNAREYIALAKGVRDYNKDDQVHVRLVQFIRTQGEFLEKMPEDKRIREGKVLVSRERWATLPKDERAKHVTFSDGDILDMLAVGGRQYLQATIKAEYARLEKAGFKKTGAPAAPKVDAPPGDKKPDAAAPAPKPAAKPAATQPPKGGATPAPGAGASAKPPATNAEKGVLAALGYEKV